MVMINWGNDCKLFEEMDLTEIIEILSLILMRSELIIVPALDPSLEIAGPLPSVYLMA